MDLLPKTSMSPSRGAKDHDLEDQNLAVEEVTDFCAKSL